MKQEETEKKEIAKQFCNNLGHETQPVIGYCIFDECSTKPEFCLECLKTQIHSNHQEYCKDFKEILEQLDERIAELKQVEKEFLRFISQYWKGESLVKKIYSYETKNIMNKFNHLAWKVQSISLKFIKKKQLLEQQIQLFQSQNYESFKTNHNVLKRLLNQTIDINVFRKICGPLEEKQQNVFWLMQNAITVIKISASLYFKKGYKMLLDLQLLTNQKQKEKREVIPVFDKAIDRNKNLLKAYLWKGKLFTLSLGYCLVRIGYYEAAITCCDQAIELFNENKQKGDSFEIMAIFENAMNWSHQSIKLRQTISQVLYNQGYSLQILQQFQDAKKYFEEALVLNPNNFQVFIKIGLSFQININIKMLLIVLINKDEKRHYVKYQNTKMHQKNMKKLLNKILKIMVHFFPKGITLEHLGKLDEAFQCYDEALTLNPKLSKKFNNKGIPLKSQNKIQENQFEYADPYVFIIKAQALEQLNKYDQVIGCCDFAIRQKLQQFLTQNKIAESLSEQGKYHEAFQCIEKYLTQGNIKYFFSLGFSLKGSNLDKQDDFMEAFINYNEAIYWNPSLQISEKMECLAKLLKLQNAADCYDKVKRKEIQTQFSNALQIKANIIKSQDNANYQSAIMLYDEAILLDPNNPSEALQKIGKRQEAIQCYDEAIRLDPTSETYKSKKHKIFFYFQDYLLKELDQQLRNDEVFTNLEN